MAKRRRRRVDQVPAAVPPRTFEARWLQRYGIAFNDPRSSLTWYVGGALVMGADLSRGARVLAPKLRELLEEHGRSLRQVVTAPIPGRAESFTDLRVRERERAASSTGLILAGQGARLRERLEALETVRREVLDVLQELVACEAAPGGALRAHRPSEYALGWAASLVAAWIRTHHRDRHGRLDGRCSWEDAAAALERWGYDLSRYERDPGNGLRKLVERHWRRWGYPPTGPAPQ